MRNRNHTPAPNLVKIIECLTQMLVQDTFFPTTHWESSNETDQNQYLVWDRENESFRGPWPTIGLVNRLLSERTKNQPEDIDSDILRPKMVPAHSFMKKPETLTHYSKEKREFWNECWTDDPRYLFLARQEDDDDSWYCIRPSDVTNDFTELFEMRSILDICYWFNGHPKHKGVNNILLNPCNIGAITESKNEVLESALNTFKSHLDDIRNCNEYNLKFGIPPTMREDPESHCYRTAFGHIENYLITKDNRIFRHGDIQMVLEVGHGYFHEDYMISRCRLLALSNEIILVSEHLGYELFYSIWFETISPKGIVKRFFNHFGEKQKRIENCPAIMDKLIKARAIC